MVGNVRWEYNIPVNFVIYRNLNSNVVDYRQENKSECQLKQLSCDLPAAAAPWVGGGSLKARVDILTMSSHSTWTRLKKVIVRIVVKIIVKIICHLKEMLKLNLQEVDLDEAFIYQKLWSQDFLRVNGQLSQKKLPWHSILKKKRCWSTLPMVHRT